MAYQVGRDYSGVLEKKNALGIWAKKFASLTGCTLTIKDSENGPTVQSIDVASVLRGGEISDPLAIVIGSTNKAEEKSTFKAEDAKKAEWWYDLIHNALEAAGRVKPRNAGLPDVDPRHNLKFVWIPAQYQARFAQLDNAVLYWFSPVKKYGAKSIVGRHTTEERIIFVTDKCVFVTKPDSEVTRCMRITQMSGLYTNIDVKEKANEETFVVLKMKEPDYDLYVALPDAAGLVHVICTLHKQLTKGKELPVTQVSNASAPGVNMQLSRRGNFEMKVVVPLQKEALKTALDAFAKEKGIVFTKTGQIKKAKDITKEGGVGGGAGGEGKAKKEKPLEPLDKFFIGLSLPQYAAVLTKQQVDLDVLECMDDDDIKNFGVKDAAHVKLIKEKLKDSEYMAKCRSKLSSPTPADGGASPSAAKPAGGGAGINLDSDDDLLGGGGGGAVQPAGAGNKAVNFDDSDDDFLSLAPAGGSSTGIVLDLDSDDDFDLGGAKSAISAKPISLDSDDDI